MAKNHRIPVMVTRKQKREYERVARAQGKSVGQLVREALDAVVARAENPPAPSNSEAA